MRVGIVGGSFDPIHYGHLEIAREVLDNIDVEEVWMMPCYKHVFGKKTESFEHRKNMIDLALEEFGESRIRVSDFENRRKGVSYTVDTVRGLLKEDPGMEIYWAVGSDIMESFEQWKEPYELIKLAKLVILSRNGNEPAYVPENSIYLRNSRIMNVSSTKIKKLLREGKPIDGLTPEPVIDYIRENGLYLSGI